MDIKLDKKGLVRLIKGCDIGYELMSNPKIKWCGNYIGGFVDGWKWDIPKLNELSEENLVELYNIINQA